MPLPIKLSHKFRQWSTLGLPQSIQFRWWSTHTYRRRHHFKYGRPRSTTGDSFRRWSTHNHCRQIWSLQTTFLQISTIDNPYLQKATQVRQQWSTQHHRWRNFDNGRPRVDHGRPNFDNGRPSANNDRYNFDHGLPNVDHHLHSSDNGLLMIDNCLPNFDLPNQQWWTQGRQWPTQFRQWSTCNLPWPTTSRQLSTHSQRLPIQVWQFYTQGVQLPT
jgi:hypothetical protein